MLGTITADVKTLSVEDCKALLGRNPRNRRLDRGKVDSYSRDMAAGNWMLNGESICIDWNGDLINGMHRLNSAVKAKKPLTSVLVQGLNPKVIKTIDSGKKRTFSNQLEMDGVKNAKSISTCIQFLYQVSRHAIKASGLTNSEMYDLLEKHPGIIQSVELCKNVFQPVQSWLPAVHYIGCYLDQQDDANLFVQIYRDGQKTYEDDPVVFAREFFIKDAMRQKRADIDFRRRLFLKSWHMLVERRPLKRANVDKTFGVKGFLAEDFTPNA